MEKRIPAVYRPMIRDMHASERPRERLSEQGPRSLSNAELLAIQLRVGGKSESVVAMATRILSELQGLAGLARVSFEELCAIKGLGKAKAAQVMAALELGRRLAVTTPDERVTIGSAQDVRNLLHSDMALLDQEHLRVLLLSTRNQVLSIAEVYKGTVDRSQVRIAEVFRDAIRANAPSIIVAHNHPSGDPSPSRDDVDVTRLMIEAGKLLNVEVLDHVVIGNQGYVSIREKRLADFE